MRIFCARNYILSKDPSHHSLHDEMYTSESLAVYFGCVLQSTDRFTDLQDKKSLLKDGADNSDGITIAMRRLTTGIHSLKAMAAK